MAGKLGFGRWLRYKYLSFIRIKDKPRNIAIGAALGLSFDILPTFGLGVVFAYFFATALKVNRLATVITAVVFKLAIPFFVFLNLKTGHIVLPGSDIGDNGSAVASMFDMARLGEWSHLGKSFLLGSMVNAVLAYGAMYLCTYGFIVVYRERRLRRRLKASA